MTCTLSVFVTTGTTGSASNTRTPRAEGTGRRKSKKISERSMSVALAAAGTVDSKHFIASRESAFAQKGQMGSQGAALDAQVSPGSAHQSLAQARLGGS